VSTQAGRRIITSLDVLSINMLICLLVKLSELSDLTALKHCQTEWLQRYILPMVVEFIERLTGTAAWIY